MPEGAKCCCICQCQLQKQHSAPSGNAKVQNAVENSPSSLVNVLATPTNAADLLVGSTRNWGQKRGTEEEHLGLFICLSLKF